MREREFRAWLKNEKKMVDVKSIDFIEKEISYIEIKGTQVDLIAYESFNDIELIEYTGLKDKNGVKIFEGDIVECDGETCTVAWNDYYLAYTLNCKEFGYDNLGDFESKDLEVIGNIYENPELLEMK